MGDSERLEGITPRAAKVDETYRAALGRARAGEMLTAVELRAILRISESTFRRHLRAGEYDAFRCHPRIGPARYAGLKVARYVDGEGVIDTDRVFGRRKRLA
jgi:DNA-binding transcriptional ArsR family regulator